MFQVPNSCPVLAFFTGRKYMMRKNFRVRYTPPDETHRAHATQIMNNSYWVDVEGEYDSQSRIDKGKQLLHMLNGDWKSTKIVHHCTAGCCLDNEDAFRKSWAAVRATVFAERPGTPAMNKWTQCISVGHVTCFLSPVGAEILWE